MTRHLSCDVKHSDDFIDLSGLTLGDTLSFHTKMSYALEYEIDSRHGISLKFDCVYMVISRTSPMQMIKLVLLDPHGKLVAVMPS